MQAGTVSWSPPPREGWRHTAAEAETGGAAAAVAGESGGNGWMQAWLPMLWKVQAALPPTHVAQRVALLRAMARLAQHAPLAMLARCQQVLRHLVGKLDDEQQDVSAACEQARVRVRVRVTQG